MQKVNYLPTTLLEFGPGSEVGIARHIALAGLKHILICYGNENIRKQGLFQSIARQLTREGVAWTGYSGLADDASMSAVKKAIVYASHVRAGAILSIGGGALLDNMKTSATTIEYCGEPWEYYTGSYQISQAIPIYALLTLSRIVSLNY